jgi:hypothetical protein
MPFPIVDETKLRYIEQEDYMAQPVPKPKKLWGNPKVFLSANELIVEEKYYVLAQTQGAYVEPVPVAAKTETTQGQPEAPVSFGTKVLQVVSLIVGLILVLLALIFVVWWNDSYSGGGSSKKYRLILVSDLGTIVALEHQNEKKLKEIASTVNQTLVARGITPQTNPRLV